MSYLLRLPCLGRDGPWEGGGHGSPIVLVIYVLEDVLVVVRKAGNFKYTGLFIESCKEPLKGRQVESKTKATCRPVNPFVSVASTPVPASCSAQRFPTWTGVCGAIKKAL